MSRLILNLSDLESGPKSLQGTLPGALLDVEEEISIRVTGDLSYDLVAERVGEELLVRGSVEVPLELECSRSGAFFSTKGGDSHFLRDYSSAELSEAMDLTDDVREAVLLNIPPYPVSPEARSEEYVPPGVSVEEEPLEDGQAGPWSDLDNLNLS